MLLYQDTIGLQTGDTASGGVKYLITLPIEVIKAWNADREAIEGQPLKKRDGMQMVLTNDIGEDLKTLKRTVLVIVPPLPLL